MNQTVTQSAETTTPVPPNIVLVCYHWKDDALYNDLVPHLNMLACRCQGICWQSLAYPLASKNETEQRAQFLDLLAHTLLFVPCTSADFLAMVWRWWKAEPELQSALAHVAVAPIALRAASGVQALCSTPLAAYPVGELREQACVQVAQALEKRLHKLPGKHRLDPQAGLMVTQTATLRLLR